MQSRYDVDVMLPFAHRKNFHQPSHQYGWGYGARLLAVLQNSSLSGDEAVLGGHHQTIECLYCGKLKATASSHILRHSFLMYNSHPLRTLTASLQWRLAPMLQGRRTTCPFHIEIRYKVGFALQWLK